MGIGFRGADTRYSLSLQDAQDFSAKVSSLVVEIQPSTALIARTLGFHSAAHLTDGIDIR